METNTNNAVNQLGNPTENIKQQEKDATMLVKEGIHRAYPQLDNNQVNAAAEQMMRSGNEKVKVGDTEVNVGDFSFIVARSIQTINSETSPLEEFYRWIDDAKDVISEMTDNEITESDLKHREQFLGDMNQREIEIKTCIALYQNAATFGSEKVREQAQKQLEFLRMKWAKLLELRSAVQNSTKNRLQASLEPNVSEDEHDRGKLYVMALYYMRKGLEIPMRMKLKLGLVSGIHFEHSLSDEFVKHINKEPETKEQVIERINILRGRQDPTYRPKSIPERQNFNPEYFRYLESRVRA